MGLEAALGELGTLYTVARSFAALQARAEAELLPRTTALSRKLRTLLRTAQLTADEIDAAAQEILALRAQWLRELGQLRASAVYQKALAAMAHDEQTTLARLLPLIFAGLSLATPAPDLFFPVSASSSRRRPGSSPFVSAPDCASTIRRALDEGLVPDAAGAEWWERELPSLGCTATPAALDTPVSLRLAAADVAVAVFRVADDPSYRVFTPRLRAPFAVVLAIEATDEWWNAYADSYHVFRNALQQELAARGLTVSLVDLSAAEDTEPRCSPS